jgi:hypothetical protein
MPGRTPASSSKSTSFELIRQTTAGAKLLLLVVAGVALLAGVWRSVWQATGQGAVVAIAVFIVAGLRQSPSRSRRQTVPISASEEPSFSTCS